MIFYFPSYFWIAFMNAIFATSVKWVEILDCISRADAISILDTFSASCKVFPLTSSVRKLDAATEIAQPNV